MNRILTFHLHDTAGNTTRMSPSAYYIEGAYEPVAVRIYAEQAPTSEATFDIFDDGVSIFSNKVTRSWNRTTGVEITGQADTTIGLAPGQQSEELAENFNGDSIDQGSWVSCNLVTGGGGKNFTVQLDLLPVSEEE